jgi:hypothetical protein
MPIFDRKRHDLWGPWTGAAFNPAKRRAYLKHRALVRSVALVLVMIALVVGTAAALAGFEAPQL